MIEQGRVTVNGKRPEVGTKVTDKDDVRIDGKPLKVKEKAIYLALNKPVGITCTTETHVKGNIITFINHPKRIFPIGRLDKPSEGLIFLTNDGDIVNKILRAGNNHEKEYLVEVNKPITQDFIQKMSNGVPILDTITQKCFVKQESKFGFRIVLTQGLNRQIRRMCEYLGYEVTKLKRIRIMNISLGNLPVGKWRYLTDKEINTINSLVADSSKTEEASQVEEMETFQPLKKKPLQPAGKSGPYTKSNNTGRKNTGTAAYSKSAGTGGAVDNVFGKKSRAHSSGKNAQPGKSNRNELPGFKGNAGKKQHPGTTASASNAAKTTGPANSNFRKDTKASTSKNNNQASAKRKQR